MDHGSSPVVKSMPRSHQCQPHHALFIHTNDWDDDLLALFHIPRSMLPKIQSSSSHYGDAQVGQCMIPIAGVAGDQQASLFGQQCFEPGHAKSTYGTGCFLLMNTGTQAVTSTQGLITTVAIGPQGQIHYALEGSVFMAGATVQWLRDQMGFLQDDDDSEYFASKVPCNEGVYIVPAFTGLSAPWNHKPKALLLASRVVPTATILFALR